MKLKHMIAASAALACAVAAHAQSAGSFILNAGWTAVIPEHNVANPEGFFTVKAIGGSAAGLSGTYFITDNIASELALSTPTEISLTGGINDSGYKLGTVKQFSPTLSLKYYFLNAEDKFRPYVGVGVSRVSFNNKHVESQTTGHVAFNFKNKWAPVANAGFTYQFTEQLFGGVSVSYMPLDAGKITITPDIGETATSKLKFNPITTFVSIGYKF